VGDRGVYKAFVRLSQHSGRRQISQDVLETPPSYSTVERPSHVPESHVVDFDYLNPDLSGGDVYWALSQLHAGPDIKWTGRNGGHWIVSRTDDIRWVQESWELFSHKVKFIPRGSVQVRLPPLTEDPPMHARYRAIFNPFFTASRVAGLADKARSLTIRLVEELRPRGRCDFVREFAQVMPVDMFLGIVDLPLDRRAELVEWAVGFVGAADQEARDSNMAKVVGYLGGVLDERYRNPGDDMLSKIAAWRDNPRYESEAEVIGMAVLIFLGGLDTVANLLSFTAMHLAEHPEHRRRLVEDPTTIPRAVEEYIRRFGLSNTGRLITQDVERKGVVMKKDELVLVAIGASSVDGRRFPDPFTVDFDREVPLIHNEPGHNTFGNGPHKCVGRPLARAELRIFLEEWLRRIPNFAIDPACRPSTRMGGVNSVKDLHLVWNS
jgi:cytochrome P450